MRAFYSLGLLLSAFFAFAQQSKVLEVARLPSFTEAPVFDRDGNLFVSEPFGSNVSKISPTGDVSTWASTGNPNGHKILADGTHLVCDRVRHAVLRMNSAGVILDDAVTTCGDLKVQAPNDLVLDPAGGFYFTDTGPLNVALEQAVGMICHVDKNGRTRVVADNLPAPNGIVLRTDGSRLLVSLSGTSQIAEFLVEEPGEVGDMRIFADRGSDGLALDADGNLYVTGRGPEGAYIGVIDETSELIATHPLPFAFVSNMVFGGSELAELWVTGQDSIDPAVPILEQVGPKTGNQGVVYRLKLDGVRGLATLPSKN